MAHLRCDKCGSSDTNAFGSWDTPITILCGKCSSEKRKDESWNMRQASGEAVSGFIAFLKGESISNNPYDDAKTATDGVKYKDWAAGWRNGEKATPRQIEMFKWIYSF